MSRNEAVAILNRSLRMLRAASALVRIAILDAAIVAFLVTIAACNGPADVARQICAKARDCDSVSASDGINQCIYELTCTFDRSGCYSRACTTYSRVLAEQFRNSVVSVQCVDYYPVTRYEYPDEPWVQWWSDCDTDALETCLSNSAPCGFVD